MCISLKIIHNKYEFKSLYLSTQHLGDTNLYLYILVTNVQMTACFIEFLRHVEIVSDKYTYLNVLAVTQSP